MPDLMVHEVGLLTAPNNGQPPSQKGQSLHMRMLSARSSNPALLEERVCAVPMSFRGVKLAKKGCYALTDGAGVVISTEPGPAFNASVSKMIDVGV